MSDDAHDWKEDLLQGRINSAGAKLLRYVQGKEVKTRTVPEAISELTKIYWQQIIPSYCQAGLKHLNQARQMIDEVSVVKNKIELSKLLDPIESAFRKTLDDRQEAVSFLKTYQNGQVNQRPLEKKCY